MNLFDQHIKDKMQNLEVKPSPQVKAAIKSQYPKQSFTQIVKSNIAYIAATVVIVGLTALFVSQNSNTEPSYQPDNYPFDAYTNESLSDTPDKMRDANPKISNFNDEKVEIVNGEFTTVTTYNDGFGVKIMSDDAVIECDRMDLLKISKDGTHLDIQAKEKGEYFLLVCSKDGNRIDTLLVNFLEKPDLLSYDDTLVCGLSIEFNEIDYPGTWILPDDMNMKHVGDRIIISASDYDIYEVKYQLQDEVGELTDKLNVQFIPEPELIYSLTSMPNCYGDPATLLLDEKQAGKVSLRLSQGEVIRKNNGEVRLDFDYTGESAAELVLSYQDANCKLSDTLVIPLPQKPDYELLVTNADCYQDASVEIKVVSTENYKAFIDDTEYPLNEIKAIAPGSYRLHLLDHNACVYSDEFLVGNESSIKADFDLEFAMDGMSVKLENTSNVNSEGGETTYEWYLNNEFVSSSKSPSIDLFEISNTIRLQVQSGNCMDEKIVSDIRPDKELIRCGNFFTPNGDGHFDEFKVILDPSLKEFEGKILSRTGQLIYEWNDPDNAWDGRYNGSQDAAETVYFYIIQAVDSTGKIIEKRGTIQLIRD